MKTYRNKYKHLNIAKVLNILIEKGLESFRDEIMYWDKIYRKAEELVKRGFKLSHGRLNKILEEDRAR